MSSETLASHMIQVEVIGLFHKRTNGYALDAKAVTVQDEHGVLQFAVMCNNGKDVERVKAFFGLTTDKISENVSQVVVLSQSDVQLNEDL